MKVAPASERARGLPSSRKTSAILAVTATTGIAVGLISTRAPVIVVFGVLGGCALFALIYSNLLLGIALFAVFNLVIPQAGPTWNLGLGTAMLGEGRGIHFNLQEIVMAMTFVAWVIRATKKEAAWKTYNPVMIGIALYVLTSILACFIGIINGANGLVLAFRFVRTVVFVYMFFPLINIVRTREAFHKLIIVMLVCFTLVAAFGLVQKGIGQTKTEWIAEHVFKKLGYPTQVNYVAGESEGQAYRINSTFLHPNILGGYLVFALPFFVSLLSLYWRRRQTFVWFLLLVGLGANLAALFLTGSRAAWVSFGVIALAYGLFGFMDRRVWLAAATVMMIIALIFVMLHPPDFVKKRFSGISAKEAVEARAYSYKIALDTFLAHPFFGIGMGMEGQRLTENNIRYLWAAVENAYLTYLVSHGLVGLTAFLLMFAIYWCLLLRARSGSRDDPFVYFHAEAFILGMVGYAVANMFGAWILFAIPMLTLFWFYLGMGSVLYNLYREERAVKPIPFFAISSPISCRITESS